VAGPQVERSTHLTLFRRKHPARWFSRGGPLPPVLLAVFVLGAVPAFAGGEARAEFPVPRLPYAPRGYVAPRALEAPQIDGRPDDAAWQEAAWTEDFVDIEGPLRPAPRFRTRAKMLWDDRYFYVLAEMEEPDLWATYDRRDAIIFHEHDFEIFLDPDGDTHEYYELEINARNNVWDLLLVRPYRDGGPAVHAWDIAGLRTAVRLDGTLNDPTDRDRGWHAEIALPWEILKECAHRPAPPAGGDRWRLNFSRVEWRLEPAADGDGYRKVLGADGKPLPEDNWVWSPQGLVNMHYPERWGIVEFSDAPAGGPAGTAGGAAGPSDAVRAARAPVPPSVSTPDDATLRRLRLVYYAQRRRGADGSPPSEDPAWLRAEAARLEAEMGATVESPAQPPPGARATASAGDEEDAAWAGLRVVATPGGFEAVLPGGGSGDWWHIDEAGRTWRSGGTDAGRP